MNIREKIFSVLDGDSDFKALIPTVVSLYDEVPSKPWATIRMGTTTSIRKAGRSGFFSLWINDVPGDFGKIDDGLAMAIDLLEAVGSEDDLIEIHWIETVGDLPIDQATGTIARYGRFQYTTTRR